MLNSFWKNFLFIILIKFKIKESWFKFSQMNFICFFFFLNYTCFSSVFSTVYLLVMLCHFCGASTWQGSDHEDLVYSYLIHILRIKEKFWTKKIGCYWKSFMTIILFKNLDCWSSLHNDESGSDVLKQFAQNNPNKKWMP